MDIHAPVQTSDNQMTIRSIEKLLGLEDYYRCMVWGAQSSLSWSPIRKIIETPTQDTLHLTIRGNVLTLPVDVPLLCAAKCGELDCLPTTPVDAALEKMLLPYVRYTPESSEVVDKIDSNFGGHSSPQAVMLGRIELNSAFG